VALSLTLCPGPMASGQDFRGIVAGTVTDETGAVLTKAQVTQTAHATSTTRSTQTDDRGFYIFQYVPSACRR
jgi:Carboxypeptidase regulatory-like domain